MLRLFVHRFDNPIPILLRKAFIIGLEQITFEGGCNWTISAGRISKPETNNWYEVRGGLDEGKINEKINEMRKRKTELKST